MRIEIHAMQPDEEIDYKDRQAQRDVEYLVQFDAWWKSLSVSERENAESMGIKGAKLDSQNVGVPELDLDRLADEESPTGEVENDEERPAMADALRNLICEILTSSDPRFSLECAAAAVWLTEKTASDIQSEHPGSSLSAQEIIQRLNETCEMGSYKSRRACKQIVAELYATKNAKLSIECLSLVTGIGYTGESETIIAERHGVTRAAVSKRCVELCERFNLPPARAMKSEDARASYRAAQLSKENPNT